MSNRRKVRRSAAEPWREGLRPVVVRLRSGALRDVDLAAFDLTRHPWFCAECGQVSDTAGAACEHAGLPGAEGYCVQRVAAASALAGPGAVLTA